MIFLQIFLKVGGGWLENSCLLSLGSWFWGEWEFARNLGGERSFCNAPADKYPFANEFARDLPHETVYSGYNYMG